MTPPGFVITVAFTFAFLLGVRASWRLWHRYHDDTLRPRSLILLAFLVVAVVVTVVAGWVGFLAVRRMLGFEALSWSPALTYALAFLLALIPEFLSRIVNRIERGES